MMSLLKKLLLAVFLFAVGMSVSAQERITVRGRVMGFDGNPLESVKIYAFSSYDIVDDECKRAEEELKSKGDSYAPLSTATEARTDERGDYELTVYPEGGLLFLAETPEKVCIHVEYVENRREINPEIDNRVEIDGSGIINDALPEIPQPDAISIGDTISVAAKYVFDLSKVGEVKSVPRENSRLVVQPCLEPLDGGKVLWADPILIKDAKEFATTQVFRNDMYGSIVSEEVLNEDLDSLDITFKFKKPDQDKDYYCKVMIQLEDYLKVYYCDTLQLANTARLSRPFQFLEYGFGYGQLDHDAFRRDPKPQTQTVPRNMKLKFGEGSSRLNLSDPVTVESLRSLREELTQVVNSSKKLDTLCFEGFASPDGTYSRNYKLSQDRTNTVRHYVLSALPRQGHGMKIIAKGFVCPWGDVADILEKDSFMEEAETIRNIERMHPEDIDAQTRKIKRLECYNKIVVPRLEQLRVVRCTYKYQEFRERTVEEVWKEYSKDPEFVNGTNDLTLYDCWRLFKMVDNQENLEKLYRLAYRKSRMEEGRVPWELPVNNLAVMLLEREQADTSLLSPFISFRHNRLNALKADGTIVNRPEIVKNQVLMYIKAKEYLRAYRLSSLLKDKDPMICLIAGCLAGAVSIEAMDKETLEKIRNSSPRNHVVVNMYLKRYGKSTALLMNKMRHDDPVTLYLKAQRICKEYVGSVQKMRQGYFDRTWDPNFEHPKDAWTPAATPEQIMEQQAIVSVWEGKVKEYVHPLYKTTREYCRNELDKAAGKLKKMKSGEDRVFIKSNERITAYDAAKVYLAKCFCMDESMIEVAERDGDINEELLAEVLNEIEKEGKR